MVEVQWPQAHGAHTRSGIRGMPTGPVALRGAIAHLCADDQQFAQQFLIEYPVSTLDAFPHARGASLGLDHGDHGRDSIERHHSRGAWRGILGLRFATGDMESGAFDHARHDRCPRQGRT